MKNDFPAFEKSLRLQNAKKNNINLYQNIIIKRKYNNNKRQLKTLGGFASDNNRWEIPD